MATEMNVHGTKGAYVGGDWIPIEECDKSFNIKNGSCKGCDKPCPRSRSRNTSIKKDGTYDVVIIGAGCIGAAIARELSKTFCSVLMLEAADDVTQGATKGNSGIVHAGFDDKPGSVRAKFCWPGNQMFPQLDRELHFGFNKNGSLVVAKSKSDEELLMELMERGKQNGVKNLRIVKQAELRKMEPHIDEEATSALYSPDAGTITPYEYAIALAENAVDNGVELKIRRQVVSINKGPDGLFNIDCKHWEPVGTMKKKGKTDIFVLVGSLITIPLLAFAVQALLSHHLREELIYVTALLLVCLVLFNQIRKTDGEVKLTQFEPSKGTILTGEYEMECVRTSYIVNAAGCQSDLIANMVGDFSFKIKPRWGEYILLNKTEGHYANHVLFPAPDPVKGKGVLVQNTLWGNLILGPTARDILKKNTTTDKYELDPTVVNESRESIINYIFSKCRELIPAFNAHEVIHTFSGARAKSTRGDWIIEECSTMKNVIHVAGIDSPGIAGSPAIALEVVRLLQVAGCKLVSNPSFNPYRAPIITPKDGWKNLKAGPLGKYTDPKTNVVCKCEKVTENEIIDALHRSLPIDSTQAIRKRTRAGMGHCQGDPNNYDCECRVAEIIARENKTDMKMVGRRPFPASSLFSQRWIKEEEKELFNKLSYSN